jgi:tetratricopeptide (TPR) repeat protein
MRRAVSCCIALAAPWLLCGFIVIPSSTPDAKRCATATSDDEGIAACTQAIQSGHLSPSDLAITFSNRGNRWRHKGNYDQAIADHDAALALNPQFAEGYHNRGGAYYEKDQLDRAMADYNEALRLKPQLSESYLDRGSVWARKGEHDRAIADYSEALRLNPQIADAYSLRAGVWYTKSDYHRAIADCNEALRLNPRSVPAYNTRAAVWSHKGDHDRAIADYNAALRIDPQNFEAYTNRGSQWSAKREQGRAIADYTEALRLNPQITPAYFYRGAIQFDQGQFASAADDFSSMNRLEPSNAYSLIWGYFAQSFAGNRAAASALLVTGASKIDKAAWPAPVVDLLAGTKDVEGVMRAATDSDQKTQRGQMCEAAFYIGEWHLLHDRKAKAKTSLEQAERNCPGDFLESAGASAELKRLSQ